MNIISKHNLSAFYSGSLFNAFLGKNTLTTGSILNANHHGSSLKYIWHEGSDLSNTASWHIVPVDTDGGTTHQQIAISGTGQPVIAYYATKRYDIRVAQLSDCGSEGYLPPVGDLTCDCRVNMSDFNVLAIEWLNNTCVGPEWCNGADLDQSGSIDIVDLSVLAGSWLECTLPLCQ